MTRFEKDDIVQEILIRMWKASEKYNKDISGISTFFTRVIKNEIFRLLKRNKLEKIKRLNSLVSIYSKIKKSSSRNKSYIDVIGSRNHNFSDAVEMKDELRVIGDKLKKSDEEAYRIFILLKYGYKKKEIAKCMKISPQSLNNKIRRRIKIFNREDHNGKNNIR
jgi:RNA polymerase sigma factor (sigma-70 family)